MNEWATLGIGFGVGVLVTSLKDWALIHNLLNRIQFHRPEDYFYAQHIQKELEGQRKAPVAGLLRKILPLTKKDKAPVELSPSMMEAEIKGQLEKQAADEKEINEHVKAFDAQRRIQLRQGEM